MTQPLPLTAPEFAPDLQLLRTFEFYDRPLLFASQDSAGRVYLAVCTEARDGAEAWLFAPITVNTLLDLTDGHIDYATAFTRPVTGTLYLVTAESEARTTHKVITLDALNQEWLPEAGLFPRQSEQRSIRHSV
jgi:hypothetical protein